MITVQQRQKAHKKGVPWLYIGSDLGERLGFLAGATGGSPGAIRHRWAAINVRRMTCQNRFSSIQPA